jgi:hypothetical protein
MKKTITLLAFCLIGTLSFAQAPAIQWQKCLGGTSSDYAQSITTTTDGGYIVAGNTYSTNGDVSSGIHGGYDAWILKLYSNGNIQWQKALGGTNNDYAQSIRPTSDGGFIIVGYTNSNDGDVSGNHGGFDAWVEKISSIGNLEWQKCLGGTNDDKAYSIQLTADGGYILAGNTSSNSGDVIGNHGGQDAWVVKLSSTGSFQWQKCFGGTIDDAVQSIQPTADGGYILAGDTESNDGDVISNHGYNDAWVVKFTSTGNLQWQNAIGGTGYDYANSIQNTTEGGYIFAGRSSSNDGDVSGNHGDYDTWVVKLSNSGSIEWNKCFGGAGSESANCIQLTSDGGYVLVGLADSNNGDVTGNHGYRDVWAVKISNTGSLQWQKSLGGTTDDFANSIQPTTDGGCILTGTTDSNNGDVSGNHGIYYDIWIVKLDTILDINTFNNQVLNLYPNPTIGLLQLQTPNNTNFNQIIITDSTGKIVLEQTQNTTQVNVEQLASGLYIIKAFSGEEIFVNKFIKE